MQSTPIRAMIIKEFKEMHGIIINNTAASIIEELEDGPKTIKQLKTIGIAAKTVRYWVEEKLWLHIKKVPNLDDMRSHFYNLVTDITWRNGTGE